VNRIKVALLPDRRKATADSKKVRKDRSMPKPVEVPFAKLHGLANDFIVSSAEGLPKNYSTLARAICAYHTGVGADGFIVLFPPRSPKNDARMRIFNADGSEAEMSGNGIRCAAALLAALLPKKRAFLVETMAGIKALGVVNAENAKRWTFRVAMGRPILEAAKIPFKGVQGKGSILAHPLATSQGTQAVTVTSMGNPHCSLFVESFESLDWRALGQEIERKAEFPHRTNVEFVKVLSRQEIEVRYWERGVGQTLSSGTGSCAATVASILNGKTERAVTVKTLAGNLEITWPEGGQVIMTGPVEFIARGIFCYRG
jgi:diaminopimelate epimerase